MAAPSKNFTVIGDTLIDADSPITAGLMEDLRDNDIHLEEWMGKNYTSAVDHDHDGLNSAFVINNSCEYKLSSQSKTSDTVLADDDDLFFSFVADGVYQWELNALLQINATPDFKFRMNESGGGSGSMKGFHYNVWDDNNTLMESGRVQIGDTVALVVASNLYLLRIGGMLNWDVGGTFSFQWAQNTSSITSISVEDGSYLRWQKVK